MKAQRLRSKLLPLFLLLTLAAAAHSATRAAPNPVPLVNNPLVPDAVAPGSQGFTLTVNGTGFVSGSRVNWNGSPLATTFVNASQVTAVVPTANVAAPGTASVTVVNPGPGGGGSNVALLTVREPFTAASFAQTVLPSGSGPLWVTAADLNGDGNLDLVTSLFDDSAIAVSLGNGDGTFQAAVPYSLDGPPNAVIVADFNSDGASDLAVTEGPGFVAVLLGNGDGTFQSRRAFNLGTQGISLAAADLNSDGHLDLAVALTSGQVAVLIGKGDGTFQNPADYGTGQTRGFGIAIADFDGDGKLDLAVSGLDSTVSVLLGAGDGTFPTFNGYKTVASPASIAAADFNRDGIPDLAVQGEFGWVSILVGDGDGGFPTHTDYEDQSGLYGIDVADLNGDNRLDLAVSSAASHRSSTYLGKGDGTLVRRSDFGAGTYAVGMAAGDFNGDGKIDFALANRADDTLSLYRQLTSVLSRTYIKFGNVKVGGKATRKVSLNNIGNDSLTISRIALVGKGADAFTETNNCGSKLAAGASCKITIVFAPLSPSPFRKVRVKISDSVAKQKIFLLGTGIR